MTEKVDNFTAESLDNFDRNRWATSNGTGGQLQTEWLDNIDRNTQDLGPAGCGAAVPVVQILGPQLELRKIELSGCHNISNSPDGCPYATNIGK
jgi:hypothetical protein